METMNLNHKALKIFLCIMSLCIATFIVFIIIQQPVKSNFDVKKDIKPDTLCPLFSAKEPNFDEKNIARHFAVDTLPGLMRNGLITKLQRNTSGTYIFVDGNLWKCRSAYFKQSLLVEVCVYNKVNGYELSAQIIDSTSRKLYAQISSSAKMDFYN